MYKGYKDKEKRKRYLREKTREYRQKQRELKEKVAPKPGLSLRETLEAFYDRNMEARKQMKKSIQRLPDKIDGHTAVDMLLDQTISELADWYSVLGAAFNPTAEEYSELLKEWIKGMFALAPSLTDYEKIAISLTTLQNIENCLATTLREKPVPEDWMPLLEKFHQRILKFTDDVSESAKPYFDVHRRKIKR